MALLTRDLSGRALIDMFLRTRSLKVRGFRSKVHNFAEHIQMLIGPVNHMLNSFISSTVVDAVRYTSTAANNKVIGAML